MIINLKSSRIVAQTMSLMLLCGSTQAATDISTNQAPWLNTANIMLLLMLLLVVVLLIKIRNTSAKLLQLRKDLNHLSRTDHLTQLYKRHYFEKRLYEVFERHLRKKDSNSVLMMVAINNLDEVSKKGQTASELVTQRVVKTILERVRNTDLSGRFSEHIFIVLLRDTTLEHAEKLVKELGEKISNTTIEYGSHNISTSCQFGLAAYSKAMDSCIDWIQAADQNLNQSTL